MNSLLTKPVLSSNFMALAIIIIIQLAALYFIKPLTYDSHEYLAISKSIYTKGKYSVINPKFEDFNNFLGENPTRMRQPVYPLFLASTYCLSGGSTFLVLAVQLLLNLITFILILKTAQLILRQKLYWYSKFIIALYFPFWILSSYLLVETIFSFFLISAIYFFSKGIVQGKTKLFLISGIVLGIAFLTKPLAIFVLFTLIIPLLFNYNRSNAFKTWLLICIAFTVVISPWFIRNAVSLGDFTPFSSSGGYNFWCASLGIHKKPWIDNKEFRELLGNDYYIDRKSEKVFIEEGEKNFLHAPITMVKNGIIRIFDTWTYFPGSKNFEKNKYIFLLTTIIQIIFLILAFLGLITGRHKKLKTILLMPATGFTLVMFFSYSISRFIIPAMPFVLLLSGQGIFYLKKYSLKKIIKGKDLSLNKASF